MNEPIAKSEVKQEVRSESGRSFDRPPRYSTSAKWTIMRDCAQAGMHPMYAKEYMDMAVEIVDE